MIFPSITIPDLATLYYPRFTVPSLTQLNQFLPQSLSGVNANLIQGALNAWITIECLNPYINRKCFIFSQCYSLLHDSMEKSPKMEQIAYAATSAALMCFFPTLGMFTITAKQLCGNLAVFKNQSNAISLKNLMDIFRHRGGLITSTELYAEKLSRILKEHPQEAIDSLNNVLYLSLFFTTSSTLTVAALAVQILSCIPYIQMQSETITDRIQKIEWDTSTDSELINHIKNIATDVLVLAPLAYVAYYGE